MKEIFHYFDMENGLEICWEVTMFIGGASRHILLYYSKPMETGYPLPSGFELWMDGRLYGKAQFTQCEVNRGLMNYLFVRPEIPKEEEMYAPLKLSEAFAIRILFRSFRSRPKELSQNLQGRSASTIKNNWLRMKRPST